MKIRIDPAAIAALNEVERAQALSLLERYRQQADRNPLEIYTPHAKQLLCHQGVGVKTRAFFGGNRAGKTTMGVVDSLIQAAPKELVPEHLLPYKRFDCPFYCRVISPSRDLLNQVVIPKFREWTPKDMLKGGNFDASYKKFDRQIILDCGCRFDLMSHEQELDKFGGSALHRILYDEEPPEDIRDESWTRLLDYDGDELFAMTPLKGLTWMYEEILEASEKPQNADRIKVTISSMLENPYLPDNVKEEVFAMWGHESEVASARIYGNFIHFGGMVIPSWQDALIDDLDVKEIRDKRIYVGIDPGVRNTGLVWATYDELIDRFTIFAAYKLQDHDISQVCKSIYETNRTWGLDRVEYVIDPSARNRTLTHATSVEAEFNNYGIYPHYGQNEVEAGVFQMRRRIAHDKLKVFRSLKGWIAEARQYRIEERVDGRFAVIKQNDHIMDPTRYICMERPYLPKEIRRVRMPDENRAQPPRRAAKRRESPNLRFA